MSADVSQWVPFEPRGSSAEHRAALKSVLVRNLVLALDAWRRNGMLGEAPLVVRIGTDPNETQLTLTLAEPGVLELELEGQRRRIQWDAEAQLYSALGELFSLRALSRGG